MRCERVNEVEEYIKSFLKKHRQTEEKSEDEMKGVEDGKSFRRTIRRGFMIDRLGAFLIFITLSSSHPLFAVLPRRRNE